MQKLNESKGEEQTIKEKNDSENENENNKNN